jgi:hypothetical protein
VRIEALVDKVRELEGENERLQHALMRVLSASTRVEAVGEAAAALDPSSTRG